MALWMEESEETWDASKTNSIMDVKLEAWDKAVLTELAAAFASALDSAYVVISYWITPFSSMDVTVTIYDPGGSIPSSSSERVDKLWTIKDGRREMKRDEEACKC